MNSRSAGTGCPTRTLPRSRSGWSARRGGSGPTSPTRSSWPSATTDRSGPPAGWWPRLAGPTAPATAGCTGRGSPSRGCGSSSTGGRGPEVRSHPTELFCAWLAWSRYRVVLPTLDRTFETLVASIDQTLRRFGGTPTYGLTENVPRNIFGQAVGGRPPEAPEGLVDRGHQGLEGPVERREHHPVPGPGEPSAEQLGGVGPDLRAPAPSRTGTTSPARGSTAGTPGGGRRGRSGEPRPPPGGWSAPIRRSRGPGASRGRRRPGPSPSSAPPTPRSWQGTDRTAGPCGPGVRSPRPPLAPPRTDPPCGATPRRARRRSATTR